MQTIAWAFLLVLVDLRLGPYDVLPDALGWVILVVQLGSFLHLSRWFGLAQAGAAVGLVASLDEYLSPPAGWLVQTMDLLGTTALVFGVCSGIAVATADPARRTTATVIRWLDLALTAPALLAAAVVGDGPRVEVTGGAGLLLVLVWVVPTLAVAVWFCVFVHGTRDVQPEAVAA